MKDAPDAPGWWLMIPADTRWIRDALVSYVDDIEVWNVPEAKWFKLKAQP